MKKQLTNDEFLAMYNGILFTENNERVFEQKEIDEFFEAMERIANDGFYTVKVKDELQCKLSNKYPEKVEKFKLKIEDMKKHLFLRI